jgi:4-hydroxy-tetrahydrodipicolinate synthase
MSNSFGAILTAMVTPFDASGKVDEEAGVRLLHHLMGNGSDGVVVCGTTGEASTLDDGEHLGFIKLILEEMRRSYPNGSVIASVGSNDTRHAVKLTEAATEMEPDGLLSVNPYYNRPSRKGILSHYAAVNAATNLPVLLYNIPLRTGSDLSNELLSELAQMEHIIGVKQSNPANLAKIDGMQVYAGNDDLLAQVLDMGEPGGILTSSHVFGNEMRRMVTEPDQRQAVHTGLAEVYRDMGIAPAASTCKAALNMIGVEVGEPRLPYVPLEADETAVIGALLTRRGLLQAAQA